ncbi:MAG: flagellar basal body L-ring protein FlgH [Pseudomonadota bacterium]|nr:flagellar basal body L-ring protein FlgH [Pseudomonadota bacterium]
MRFSALAALAVLPLAACSALGSSLEAARTPQFTPVAYPAPLVGHVQPVAMVQTQPASSANSLWKVGARAFFKDQRATRVGDILTVAIEIDDSAEVDNSISRKRDNEMSGGVTNLLGMESSLGRVLPGGFDPQKALGFGGESSASGDGQIKRAEKISLTVAAVVTHVLPNGNMMIQGRQEVRTNQELRELTVAGIVRPEDITARNTINHTQIAEARISYGGRGPLTRSGQMPAGQAVMERLSPF